MSDIVNLQQHMQALLQECEARLAGVEQVLVGRRAESASHANAEQVFPSVVESNESSQVTEPAKSPASAASESQEQDAANRNRAKNRAANQAALQLLFETYPQVFSRGKVRPLKIGIQEDLIADDKLARSRIKRALASYVRNPHYLRSLQAGAERIGLDGQAAGQVSEEEAAHARDKLKSLKAERREREKRAKDQAREQERQQKEQRLNSKLGQLLQLNKRAR